MSVRHRSASGERAPSFVEVFGGRLPGCVRLKAACATAISIHISAPESAGARLTYSYGRHLSSSTIAKPFCISAECRHV